jgi:hypothetical protein
VNDDEVRLLGHERAIRSVVARYCRGIDRMDRELLRSCYHSDATDEHGEFSGGVDAFLDYAWGELARFSSTMHFLGQVLIEFAPGREDAAVAETYAIAFHVTGDGNPRGNWSAGLRYLDRFERRPELEFSALGAWKIARRVVVGEWYRSEPVERFRPVAPSRHQARRGPDDPIFAMLAGLDATRR